MRRVNLFILAAVASVGIFLSAQSFAQSATSQDQYYQYQSSRSQVNTTHPLSQPFGFRTNSDMLRSHQGNGVVVQRTEVPNPSYYEQSTPSYYEPNNRPEDRSYYYQNRENREYEYSQPNAAPRTYYNNDRYSNENDEYEYSRPNTAPHAYNNERYSTMNRENERYQEQYDYSAPGTSTYEYYGNQPVPNQYGNSRQDLRMQNTLRPDYSSHPFFYQSGRSSDFSSSHGTPGGHYNPHGPLQESPRTPE